MERESFEKLRTSPYRNYVNRIYFRDCPILYLAGIERTERVEELYRALEAEGLLERVRARIDPPPPGFRGTTISASTTAGLLPAGHAGAA